VEFSLVVVLMEGSVLLPVGADGDPPAMVRLLRHGRGEQELVQWVHGCGGGLRTFVGWH
jgi:hypothetical protein